MNKPTGILIINPDSKVEYQIINEWQLCPKCNGSGLVLNLGWPYSDTLISTAPVICDVCNGKKIISKVNGLPPTD